MESPSSSPITSPVLLELIAKELRSMYEGYYLVFKIMIETGYNLNGLLKCKVRDLKDKSTLSVPTSRKSNYLEDIPISEELQKDLKNYLEDFDEDDYAFTSRFTGKKLHVGTIKKALLSVSKHHGIDPPLTVASIAKTYKYNEVLNGNYVRKHSKYSFETLYKTLGLEIPEDDDEYLKHGRVKTTYYKEDMLRKFRERVETVFDTISRNTERPDRVTTEYLLRVLDLLTTIDTAINEFNKGN